VDFLRVLSVHRRAAIFVDFFVVKGEQAMYSRRFVLVIAFVSSLFGASFGVFGATAGGGIEPSTFGRNLIFLGLAGTGSIVFDSTCVLDPPIAPPDQCVLIQPAAGKTNFDFEDLGSIYIPGGSTVSIIWPEMTYIINYELNNTTGVPQASAMFHAHTIITIESAELNDPTLVDPVTGLPYNGKIVTIFPVAEGTDRSLAVAERIQKGMRFSATGIGAFNHEFFVGANIPEKVIKRMFAKPMTVRVGISGNIKLVDTGLISIGFRLMGDQ
jgi:hypothetical protein